MKGKIFEQTQPDFGSLQYWLDPTTKRIEATYGVKKDAVSPFEDSWPVYSLTAHYETQRLAQKGDVDEDRYYDAFLDSRIADEAQKIKHDVEAGGEQRTAALRSDQNSAVNIINVWTELQGRRDRKYARINLAKMIPVKNLVISVEKVKKPGGMTRLDEGQLIQLKSLVYTRQNFTAQKYGWKFVVHEEARLKNVHNVMQDLIYIAGNKIEQRQSYDVINACTGLTSQAATSTWDTFVSGTSRSDGRPLVDIGIAQTNIEGTAVGARLTRIGMHQLTLAGYLANSDIRGIAPTNPVKYDFKPGTGELPGLNGIGLVKDQGIQQGIVYCVDTETEDATIHLYQGPQRLGSAHDEETGDDKYFIIDYHLAQLAQSETGFQITGASGPLVW